MSDADAPDWVTLTEGEEVLWDGHPSPVPYLFTLVGEFVLIALGIAILLAGGIVSLVGAVLGAGIAIPIALPSTAIAGGLVAVGLVSIAGTLLRWWSVHYLLTTEEVYRKTGILSRTVQNLRLEEVQNTTFTQSWFGRLASYGTVLIATAGTGGVDIAFRHAEDPGEVVETITRQLDRVRS